MIVVFLLVGKRKQKHSIKLYAANINLINSCFKVYTIMIDMLNGLINKSNQKFYKSS